MKKKLTLVILFFIALSLNAQTSNTLNAGETLKAGQKLFSANGKYMLDMQKADGNLCIYKNNNGNRGQFVWCSMKHGFKNARLVMQTDGNLVVYDGANNAKWASNTQPFFNAKFKESKNKPLKFELTNNGTLALFAKNNVQVWSNSPSYLIIDKVWTNRNYVEFEFKSDGNVTRNGEKIFNWSWQDVNNTIMKLTDLRLKNKHAYYKFTKVKEKSMRLEYSLTGPSKYEWQDPYYFIIN